MRHVEFIRPTPKFKLHLSHENLSLYSAPGDGSDWSKGDSLFTFSYEEFRSLYNEMTVALEEAHLNWGKFFDAAKREE